MEETNYGMSAFNRLYKELGDIYCDIAKNLGISDSAFDIFYIIHELGDGCLQKDICRECYVSKQTINSSIRKLEREGYLYLTPGKGHDKHIHLTAKGQVFVQNSILPVCQMEQEAFELLSRREQQTLLQLTQKFVGHLQTLEKQRISNLGGDIT